MFVVNVIHVGDWFSFSRPSKSRVIETLVSEQSIIKCYLIYCVTLSLAFVFRMMSMRSLRRVKDLNRRATSAITSYCPDIATVAKEVEMMTMTKRTRLPTMMKVSLAQLKVRLYRGMGTNYLPFLNVYSAISIWKGIIKSCDIEAFDRGWC